MRTGQCRVWGWVGVLGVILASGTPSAGADKTPSRPTDLVRRVEALDQGLQAVRADLAAMREQLKEMSERLGAMADEHRKSRDTAVADDEASKQAREEEREAVRGLYVENSGIKADVAQVREDVQAVNDNIEGFRLSNGILIAVVIVLQVILAALAFRKGG